MQQGEDQVVEVRSGSRVEPVLWIGFVVALLIVAAGAGFGSAYLRWRAVLALPLIALFLGVLYASRVRVTSRGVHRVQRVGLGGVTIWEREGAFVPWVEVKRVRRTSASELVISGRGGGRPVRLDLRASGGLEATRLTVKHAPREALGPGVRALVEESAAKSTQSAT